MGALLLALLVLALVVWLGLREAAHRTSRERRRIEDALKHRFDTEYRGRCDTLSSVARAI